MSRGRDIDEREDELDDLQPPSKTKNDDRGRAGGSDPDPVREPRERADTDASQGIQDDARESIRDRDRTYWLKPTDFGTMQEIGRFRTLAEDDLAQFRFNGDSSRMEYELGMLAKQGLIRRHIVGKETARGFHACVLTRKGKQLLERQDPAGLNPGARQVIYSDLKKPTEAFHDAAIYRMYQVEAGKIRSAGGRICRVVLDYELKKKIYAPLAKVRQTQPEMLRARQEEVALANGLRVINGKIPLPDLRIEYENREGEAARVDLELATEHYKKSQLAEKIRAGFSLYFAGNSSSRTGTVWEDRELTAEILSL